MRKLVRATLALCLFAWIGSGTSALASMEYAVRVSATVQESPPQIRLTWPQDAYTTPSSYTVHRKAAYSGSWSTVANLSGGTTSYTDSGVTVGTAYEYQVVKNISGRTGYGYIAAGINVPMIENRGKVILVVENLYAGNLVTELNRLQQDLAGDGWTVIRRDVSRSDTPQKVKSVIKSVYDADKANVKAVFLFGRVPVPYSGNIVPDGHSPQHYGAWPADGYYGDMDGSWTDSSVNNTGASDARNQNRPGDGKFDQSTFPSAIELQVGRVDLFNMPGRKTWNGSPTFPSELELLRNYLNKDHNFRQKKFNLPRRGIVGDYFGDRSGEAFGASGWRNLSAFFGANNVVNMNQRGQWAPHLRDNAYLWAYGCGAGSYWSIAGLGQSGQYQDVNTVEYVENDAKAAFTMLFGSWLGDWDINDSILRAPLATKSFGLTAAWAGRPHWYFHHMGLGETIGYSTRLTQNNTSGGLYRNQSNYGASMIHVALMGDPTLRLHPVAPPTGVAGLIGSSGANLSWKAAAESVLGYHVYRASSSMGPFTRITSSLLTGTSFVDQSVTSGNWVYMVRAVKLETSATGTYFNPSQGAFWSSSGGIITSPDPTPAPSTGDTTAPTVSLAAPSNSATVSGTVTVAANASDNVGVAGVQFKLNGANLGAEDTASPYSCTWDTTKVADGTHSLTAVARDAAGNTTTSAAVSVTVKNSSTSDGTTSPSPSPSPSGTVVWIEDALPAGAKAGASGGDSWNWISSNPAPFSGSKAHQSAIASGQHQHYFDWATDRLKVASGEVMFAHVFIDPNNKPEQIMLEWNNGNWEHRAYWGANKLKMGVDKTDSRRYIGALPEAGKWVRLEVPASVVGLENSEIRGMSFTLYGGRVAWDKTGKGSSEPSNTTGDTTAPTVSLSAPSSGATVSGTVTVSANATDNVGVAGVQLKLNGANLGAEDTTSPYSISWDTTKVADGTHSLTAVARDAAGNTATSAAVSVTVKNSSTTTPPSTPSGTVAWVEDVLPAGAKPGSLGGDAWTWVSSNPTPFSGAKAHQTIIGTDLHQHHFDWASDRLKVASGEVMVAYVYIDPNNKPEQLMLEWNNGNWEHRAYWGADKINRGKQGTESRHYVGPLPEAGKWVRLEVPAKDVGLENSEVRGMAFVLFKGRVTWDLAGKAGTGTTAPTEPTEPTQPTDPAPNTGDSFVWIEDALPEGANAGASGGDAWTWVSSNPVPFSGSKAHQSVIGTKLHQHYFDWARTRMEVTSGAVLFTYVFIDPNNKPEQLMLEWNNGNWDHRAYWGANKISYGKDGTDSRRYMGPLPEAGKWVRLEVPAKDVGLENSSVKGMSFTLYGGRVTWDKTGFGSTSDSGTTDPSPSPEPEPTPDPAPSTGDRFVWVEDAVPEGANAGASGGDAWTWVSSNPAPFSGTKAHQTVIGTKLHQHYFDWAKTRMEVKSGEVVFAYVFIDPNNQPEQLMLEWNNGNWEHRAYWGANKINNGKDGTESRRYMGPLPEAGKWVRLEVPASAVGLENSSVKGMSFTLYGGRVTWDRAGVGASGGSSTPTSPTDPPASGGTAWFDDALPQGAVVGGLGGGKWNWVTSNPAPFSGAKAHKSILGSSLHQYWFTGATETMAVKTGDVLYTYAYIDPVNKPREIMLQWYSGSWDHRAYWGENMIYYGKDGTTSRRYMGPLPEAGKWVRLEVPAKDVGLEGKTVTGMDFTLYDGQVTFDVTGTGSATSGGGDTNLASVSVTATDATAAEPGTDTGTFTIARTGSTESGLAVNYTLGGTAQNGIDYETLGTTVTIPAGAASAAVVVTPKDDDLVEGSETVILSLASSTAYAVGTPASATITIADKGTDPVPPGGSTGASAVSLTSPAATATVSGTVAVSASVSGSDIAGVQFKLNGANLGAEDTSAPYTISWDSKTVTDGGHLLSAVVRDTSGNKGLAESVTVYVQNTALASGMAGLRINATQPGITGPVAVRAIIKKADGSYVPGEWMNSVWPKITMRGKAVAPGAVIQVPVGATEVIIGKGPDYLPQTITTNLATAGQIYTLDIALKPAMDLYSQGWRGGDGHIHFLHGENQVKRTPHDSHAMCAAGGLNFGSFCQEHYGAGQLTRQEMLDVWKAYDKSECKLWLGAEEPKNAWGHHASLAYDPWEIRSATPYHWGLKTVHKQGGVSYPVHPQRVFPGRFYDNPTTQERQWFLHPANNHLKSYPLNALLGHVIDGWSGVSDEGSMPNMLAPYFKLLELGHKIPFLADSDATFDKINNGIKMPGFWMTYFHLEGNEVTQASIATAMRRGRVVSTTGPLVLFTIDGAMPGDSLPADGKERTVRIEANYSFNPWTLDDKNFAGTETCRIRQIDLFRNGQVIKTWTPGTPTAVLEHKINESTDKSHYMVRVLGNENQWMAGYASPIYFENTARPRQPEVFKSLIKGRLYDAATGAKLTGTVSSVRYGQTEWTINTDSEGRFRAYVPIDAQLVARDTQGREFTQDIMRYEPAYAFSHYLSDNYVGRMQDTVEPFRNIVKEMEWEFPIGHQHPASYVRTKLSGDADMKNFKVVSTPAPFNGKTTSEIVMLLVDKTQAMPGDTINYAVVFRQPQGQTPTEKLGVTWKGYDTNYPTMYNKFARNFHYNDGANFLVNLGGGFYLRQSSIIVPAWTANYGETMGAIKLYATVKSSAGTIEEANLQVPLGPTKRELLVSTTWDGFPAGWGETGIGPCLFFREWTFEARYADYRNLTVQLDLNGQAITLRPKVDTAQVADADNAVFNDHFYYDGQCEPQYRNIPFRDPVRSQPAATDYSAVPIQNPADKTAPHIALMEPFNKAVVTSGTTKFFYHVDDFGLSGAGSATLFINGNAAASSATANPLSVNLSPGTYTWQVRASDKAGNPGASEVRTLIVK